LGPKRQQRDLQVPNHSFREPFFHPLFLLIATVIRRVFVSVTAAIVFVVRCIWSLRQEMLEDQVAYLLQRYLGNYVRGLNKEALKISVWKGSQNLN